MSTPRLAAFSVPTPDATTLSAREASAVELRRLVRGRVPRFPWSPQLALLLAAVSVLSALITIALTTLVGAR